MCLYRVAEEIKSCPESSTGLSGPLARAPRIALFGAALRRRRTARAGADGRSILLAMLSADTLSDVFGGRDIATSAGLDSLCFVNASLELRVHSAISAGTTRLVPFT
jgi:hypothetical protein